MTKMIKTTSVQPSPIKLTSRNTRIARVLGNYFDVRTGLPEMREVEIEEPGERYAVLRAELKASLRSYRHAMMTTDSLVDMSLVVALAVVERERRAALMLAGAAFLLGALCMVALLGAL